MFAARVRASLQPLFHGILSSYLIRNCEIAAISNCTLHDRFNDGARILTSLRLSGNGVGIKLFNRSFHSSPQCYTTESDVASALFSSLENFELGSVEKDGNGDMIVNLLTEKPEPFEVAKPKLSQQEEEEKKKKHEQASISKLKLLTAKPEISWKINGKKKREAHASSPARNVTYSNVSFFEPTKSSSPTRDDSIISTEAKDQSISNTPSNHPSSVVVIRISNLNSKTADSLIHSMCLSIGRLEGLSRVNEEAVDVLYRVRDPTEADSILEELNDANVDYSQWTAEIVPKAEEAFSDQIEELGILLRSVMHLENHPMAPEGS